MINAYSSTQSSSLSAFVISKTFISAQKQCGRQLNAKVCGSESAIFLILVKTTKFNNDISKTVKYLPSFYHKTDAYHSAELYNHCVYIATNSPWSINCFQFCPVAVRCVGCHFLMLYGCTHVALLPNQRPQSLVWERD